MGRARRTVCLGLLVFLSSGAACGDEPQENKEQAKQRYLRGNKLFDLAHYDEAVIEYEAAYQLKSDAVFIYNIAQCHRLAGHFEKSIRFYKNYLRLQPGSPVRADVESRVREMEHALETGRTEITSTHPEARPVPMPASQSEGQPQEAAAKPAAKDDPKAKSTVEASAAPPAPAREGSASSSHGTLTAVGAVLVAAGAAIAIGGGVGFYFAATSTAQQIDNESQYTPAQGSSLALYNDLTAAMAVGGGVVAALGAVVLVLGQRHQDKAPVAQGATLVPSVSGNSAGLALSGSF